MPRSNSTMIHRLQNAINEKDKVYKVLLNRRQWYSDDQGRPVTTYIVSQSTWESGAKQSTSHEIFSSESEIQIVLFLRDYWYKLNGWEVPTDNETWNKAKKAYYDKIVKEGESNGK